MRILIVSAVPPRKSSTGAELQVWRIARELSRGNDVQLVSLGQGEEIPSFVEGGPVVSQVSVPTAHEGPMFKVGAKVRVALGGDPYLVQALRRTGLQAAVTTAISEFAPDVLYLTNEPCGFLAEYFPDIPTVLNAIDCWSLNEVEVRGSNGALVSRIWTDLVVRGVRKFESRELAHNERVISVSTRDTAELAYRGGVGDKAVTLTNGVDLDFFAPASQEESGASVVCFHGTMDYPPNVEAAEFLVNGIMPLVWSSEPDVHVVLAGRNPTPSVRALAGGRVTVTGGVDDIRVPLSSAAVTVFPMLSGTGVKNKVLEAAAMAKPIIVTQSALGDLALASEGGAVVAEGSGQIAHEIVSLLQDRSKAVALGLAARDSVARHHSWRSIGEQCSELCAAAVVSYRAR